MKTRTLLFATILLLLSACEGGGGGASKEASNDEIAIQTPELNKTKQVALETRKENGNNYDASIFAVTDYLKEFRQDLFNVEQYFSDTADTSFDPVISITRSHGGGGFVKIDENEFETLTSDDAEEILKNAATRTSSFNEKAVYLGEFTNQYFHNRKSHRTVLVLRVDDWKENADKVKFSYRFLSFSEVN